MRLRTKSVGAVILFCWLSFAQAKRHDLVRVLEMENNWEQIECPHGILKTEVIEHVMTTKAFDEPAPNKSH